MYYCKGSSVFKVVLGRRGSGYGVVTLKSYDYIICGIAKEKCNFKIDKYFLSFIHCVLCYN